MADPTGGVGKGGGLGPIKGPAEKKGLEQMGTPKQSDADKFQTALSGGPTGESAQTKPTSMGDQMMQSMQTQGPGKGQAGGPFSMQFNRLTQAPTSVSKKEGSTGSLKDSIASGAKRIMDTGKAQKAQIQQAMNDAGKNGMSQGQVLKLQFEVGNFSILSEIVSRGVNKVVQAVQTTIKNQ